MREVLSYFKVQSRPSALSVPCYDAINMWLLVHKHSCAHGSSSGHRIPGQRQIGTRVSTAAMFSIRIAKRSTTLDKAAWH